MKKLKLDLNDLKVESFETTDKSPLIKGKIKGQAECDYVNTGSCGGGGGIGTNTWCFGEACQTRDYMYTCQDSCPNPDMCGGGGFENTQYYSCPCTDPQYDPACDWWFPSNYCPPG